MNRSDSFMLTLYAKKWADKNIVNRTVNSDPCNCDIFILGDSNIYGWGINNKNNTFPYLLQKLTSYKVYSFAYPAMNTKHELKKLSTLQCDSLNLKFIILGYFFNDIGDKEISQIIIDISKPKNKFLIFFINNSFFINYIYFTFFVDHKNLYNIYNKYIQKKYSNPFFLNSNIAELKNIQNFAENHNAKLLLLLIPPIPLLTNNSFIHIKNNFIRSLSDSNIVNIIDLSPYLISILSNNNLMLSNNDAHPSQYVHELIAKIIINYIK